MYRVVTTCTERVLRMYVCMYINDVHFVSTLYTRGIQCVLYGNILNFYEYKYQARLRVFQI